MAMDFDRPPDFWTLVWIGLGAFVLFCCCCCTTAPLYWAYQNPDMMKRMKR
jgi:hypothetical protein